METQKQVTKMNLEAKKLFLAEIKNRIPSVEEKRKVVVGFLKLKQGSFFSLDGMLCDAYLKAHNLKWNGYNDNACLGATHAMPDAVMKWAGFTRHDPYIEYKGKVTTLASFNDIYTPEITEELYQFIDQQF